MQGVKVTPLVESRFGLDGGAMFGIIPRALWTRTNPADEANRIDLGARCLLIEHPTAGRILVDVGLGDRWDAKSAAIYNMRPSTPGGARGIGAALEGVGLGVEDIDHVVLTHLHFDHAGGLCTQGEGGVTRAVFPQATHYVMRENWSWAWRPSERDRGSYREEDFAFFERADAPALRLLDGLTELFPGVTLIPRRGHTYGMAVVLVEAEEATWCHMADLIPTAGHLRVPYVMGYDLQPVVTCQEKRELLSEASRHGWRLIFEHDPEVAWCCVESDGRGDFRRVPGSST